MVSRVSQSSLVSAVVVCKGLPGQGSQEPGLIDPDSNFDVPDLISSTPFSPSTPAERPGDTFYYL